MNEVTTPALVPSATAGNLTNLIAERAWFEPERITMSRPLGDGWQSVSAREVEEVEEIVATHEMAMTRTGVKYIFGAMAVVVLPQVINEAIPAYTRVKITLVSCFSCALALIRSHARINPLRIARRGKIIAPRGR